MLKPYRTIDDVLRSPWAAVSTTDTKTSFTDRVLRSSKLENNIYSDIRSGDEAMAQMEQSAEKKLRSFPALSRDVYQSFYSLIPRRNDDSALSTLARKFNAPILDHIVQSEEYLTLKSVCEGRELPAYRAAVEFISTTANELDSLLSDIGGSKGGLNTLEKLENAETQAKNELADLLERMQRGKKNYPQLEQSVVDVANKLENKHQQVEAVSKMIDVDTAQKNADIADIIASAVRGAAEKAGEVQNIWDDSGKYLHRASATAMLMGAGKSILWNWAAICPARSPRNWLCWLLR